MARNTQMLAREGDVQHQEDAAAAQEEEKHRQAEVSPPSPILNSQGGGTGSGGTKEQPQKYYFWQKWNTVEKFTFWLMIFTMIYSVVSVWQACIAQQGVTAARIAADAAKSSADTAQQSLKLSIRPGLNVTDVALAEFSTGKEARVDFNVTNKGPGVAKNVIVVGSLLLCPPAEQARCFASCPSKPDPAVSYPPMDIESEVARAMSVSRGAISEKQAAAYSSNATPLYFCGIIRAADILENPWDVPFCSEYSREVPRWAYCQPQKINN